MIKMICMAAPQYTDRGKKTLMIYGECSYCGIQKVFRKARVDSGKTESCGCKKLRSICIGEKFGSLTILVEAPRMKNKAQTRQFYVKCVCGKKYLISILNLKKTHKCEHI